MTVHCTMELWRCLPGAGLAVSGLLLLLLCLFLIYLSYIHYVHLKFDHIPGPPRDSFLLGHIPSIQKAAEGYKIIHEKFLEWAETYGPVFRVNALHRVMLYVTHPDTVKELLMSPNCPKDPFTYKLLFNLFGERFLGNGLVTDTDHTHWYMQRRVMDPSFSHRYLAGQLEVFNEKAERLMERLGSEADGETAVPMHYRLNCVTLEVITTVAFGMELPLLHSLESPFPKAISDVLQGLVQYTRNPYMQYLPQHWGFVRRVREALKLLRQTGQRCIKQRQQAMATGEAVPQDILTNILTCAEQEGHYDDGLMLDNFITFFIAGQETTANLISFTVMELTRQPDITAKLQAEVDEVIGVKRDVDVNDIGKLQYLSQVLKETLRVYPTIPGTRRWLQRPCVIDGIHIPAPVSVILSTYIMGRMAKFFDDPLRFDPERFSPDAPKPYYCYFPFALGPRSCLGQVFAQMEAKVILAKFLQRFDFQLAPGQNYEMMDTGTLRPRGGAVCTLKPRTPPSAC
uniref:Cholesterol 24-hydroxylase n=1 Tax=Callorhinchus milii TaxID=7868 RepID=K4GCW0_CALMI|nr:cytochrome P450, family 46, subfamily A, polypeptide 1 [Callorhinchus milii]